MNISPRAVEAAIEEYRGGGSCCAEDAMRSAIAAALAVDGLCLVPKEPTDKMREVGARMSTSCCAANGCIVGDVYRAMLAAASTGDSPRQREG